MKRVKYIFRKLKTIQYKKMINIASKVHKITKKPVISIIFDMVKCATKYGAGYMDYFEFEFYLLNAEERSTYITGSINNEIVRKYNDKNYFHKLSNKVEFNREFESFLGRDYLYLKESSLEDFENFINVHKYICVKPISDCGGKGVEIIDTANHHPLELFNTLVKNNQLLVEEVIHQHSKLNELYSGSVNTLRVITFRSDNDVIVLKSIFKIGNNGAIDNFSSGGMYTFVDENGKVFVPAIDEEGNVFYEHPVTKEPIVGFHIPNYESVIALVKKLSLVVPEIRYTGWDIAITESGPVVVEGNEFSGIFQVKPSISGIKTGDLPNYRKYMEI